MVLHDDLALPATDDQAELRTYHDNAFTEGDPTRL